MWTGNLSVNQRDQIGAISSLNRLNGRVQNIDFFRDILTMCSLRKHMQVDSTTDLAVCDYDVLDLVGELGFSCKTIALIRTLEFGIKSPAPFSSASALFGVIAFLCSTLVSSSALGSNSERSL
jgi:hypothetical protein